MVVMLVRHRVADFGRWKAAFDSMAPTRAEHNWLGAEILRDATDPNVVTIINRVKDIDSAKRYGGSPKLREAMESGGVLTPPDISFLTEA
jgi:hypothetical protein